MKKAGKIFVAWIAMLLFVGTGGALWAAEAGRVNINTATAEELTRLGWVGPKIAERIVRYREENGLFKTPEDILKVSGIGPAILDSNNDRILVGESGKKAPGMKETAQTISGDKNAPENKTLSAALLSAGTDTESPVSEAGKIDVNTATAEELTQLERVGPKIAERIVRYREENGLFKTPENLLKVSGVGSAILDSNKERIVAVKPSESPSDGKKTAQTVSDKKKASGKKAVSAK